MHVYRSTSYSIVFNIVVFILKIVRKKACIRLQTSLGYYSYGGWLDMFPGVVKTCLGSESWTHSCIYTALVCSVHIQCMLYTRGVQYINPRDRRRIRI